MQSSTLLRLCHGLLAAGSLVIALGTAPAAAQSGNAGAAADTTPTSNGPIRLRQPQQATGRNAATGNNANGPRDLQELRQRPDPDERDNNGVRKKASEFEIYLERLTNGTIIRRLGADMVLDQNDRAPGTGAGSGNSPETEASEVNPVIPSDYVVGAGDEVVLTMWGAVDADLRLVVDRSGRIQIPRIGSVLVAGVSYQDLPGVIDRQAKRVFKNYELSVSLGQLRGIRVYVTGFADKPGAYSVSSLATVSAVLFKAGGPSTSGSYRNIELRRKGQTVAKLDLYELLVHGRRDADALLQAGDVVHVGAVGKQVAVIGSVNKQALVDMKPGETLEDVLVMAGGFNAVAERSRLAIEPLAQRSDLRVRQLAWPADKRTVPEAGDVVRVFSAITATQPLNRQNKRVRIEGEVLQPGEYILPPASSVADLVKAAGGYTPQAFLYGADFTRESVRQSQQTNYERALRDMEIEMSRRSNATAARTAEDQAAVAAQQVANDRLIQRLREVKPNGRVVLQVPLDSKELPDLALEDGDRLLVPPRPTTVGVFGSVFNAGSFLFGDSRSVDDYLRLAGSPTRGADTQSVFVVRANGSVISAQQGTGWFGGSSLGKQPVQPGDTVYVPEEINKISFLQGAKDWTQVLYQFGVGLAAIVAAVK